LPYTPPGGRVTVRCGLYRNALSRGRG
jgi:hypothetical protein